MSVASGLVGLVPLLGLALSGAPSESPPNFTLDLSKTTTAVRKGETGTLSVHIKPAEGFKVNEQGPLTLKLQAKDRVQLEKDKLGRGDAQGKETSPEFSCGFDAKQKGREAITVDAMFVICDMAGTICELKKERVQVAVSVNE